MKVLVIALALIASVSVAYAGDDELPRFGETAAEYNARISGKPLPKIITLSPPKTELDKANDEYRKSLEDLRRTLQQQKARLQRQHEDACDRASQRAAYNWSASAQSLYNTYCN
jgi:hypothetical protein